jgi:hypothetical protein
LKLSAIPKKFPTFVIGTLPPVANGFLFIARHIQIIIKITIRQTCKLMIIESMHKLNFKKLNVPILRHFLFWK